ncbi:Uncharacterised protein [Actinobacillus equuli]|nr:Uncharacterised protein [Actinobacillus equuli]
MKKDFESTNTGETTDKLGENLLVWAIMLQRKVTEQLQQC